MKLLQWWWRNSGGFEDCSVGGNRRTYSVVIFGAYQANGGDKKIVNDFDSVAVVMSITMKVVMMVIVW